MERSRLSLSLNTTVYVGWQKIANEDAVICGTDLDSDEQSAADQHQRRYQELREKLGITNPRSIVGGRSPSENTLEDHEEY